MFIDSRTVTLDSAINCQLPRRLSRHLSTRSFHLSNFKLFECLGVWCVFVSLSKFSKAKKLQSPALCTYMFCRTVQNVRKLRKLRKRQIALFLCSFHQLPALQHLLSWGQIDWMIAWHIEIILKQRTGPSGETCKNPRGSEKSSSGYPNFWEVIAQIHLLLRNNKS